MPKTAPRRKPAPEPEGRRRLTRREKKDLGLTFRQVFADLAEMKRAGQLEDPDPARLALEILNRRATADPSAFRKVAADPSVDWDELSAFMEHLIELILKIMALF
jgi:hypothetical protein